MPIHPHLLARLQRAALRQGRLRLLWSLAACWAGAALIGLVWMAFQPAQPGAAIIPSLGIALLGLLAALAVTIRHFDSTPDWRRFALQIEAHYPELNGLLLTAVQQDPKGGQLNYFQERLVEDALRHSQQQDWAGIIPKSRLAIAQTGHWLAVALFVITLLSFYAPENRRLIARSLRSGIEVTPGDTSIERGGNLVVLARFNGSLPSQVELVAAPSPGVMQRVPLVRNMTDPLFGGGINEVSSNLVYHIEYGNRRTRDYKVTVFEYPRLERSDADLAFPSYTAQVPKRIENTRRVSAIEGTRLDLNLQLNKPVSSARLVPKDKEQSPISLDVATNRATAVLRQFPLAASKSYDLLLVDADGRTNKIPAQFVFEVYSNRAPELKMASPRGDLRPSPLEEISFEGTVWDDFGTVAYGLGYTIGGQEMKIIELGKSVPAKEKRSFQHMLRLEDLQVRPDQLIAWFMWSDDIGPDGKVRRTPGDLFFAEVRPFEEVFREGQGMEGQSSQESASGEQQGGQAARLAELQKQIMSATWKLQRDHFRGTLAPKTTPIGTQESPSKPDAPRDRARTTSLPSPSPSIDFPGSLPARGQVMGSPSASLRSWPRVMGQADRQRPGTGAPASTNRSAARPPISTGKAPKYEDDAAVVRDSQAQALEQAQAAMAKQQDPRTALLWAAATREMEKAVALMKEAAKSPAKLPEALAAEQAAYQNLLKLQEHEFQVSRGRNRSGSQGGSSREQQMQRQLDQMELTQSENRYETQRQAQAPQSAERREQLQVMNRLQELARRQQDLNERLKELHTAFQEARNEQERAEIQRRMKRLQEEEQQMLADIDEVRQRMDRPENQSRMAEERRQLEQTRQDVQRASEAAGQGAASQALASGTRAQQQLQEMRDQMRKESSSQFANEMREMRTQARDLARQHEDLLKKIEEETNSTRKSLSESPGRQEMLDQLARQKERMTNLLDRATQVSEQAESTEPLLSRQLYDSLRQFSQESTKNVKEVEDELLERGLMNRSLYERFQQPADQDGAKLLDVTSEMVRRDVLKQASETGQRLRPSLDSLKRGVERAAESVLGDDAEALRLASQELEQLAEKVRQEAARSEERTSPTNHQASASSASPSSQSTTNRSSRPSSDGQQAQANSNRGNTQDSPEEQTGSEPGNSRREQQAQSASGSGRSRNSQQARSNSNSSNPQDSNGQRPQANSDQGKPSSPEEEQAQNQNTPGNSPSDSQASSRQPGQGTSNQPANRNQSAQAGSSPGTRRDSRLNQGQRSSSAMRGGSSDGWGGDIRSELDRLLEESAASRVGPITGEDFVPWSDRLREVEEMIDIPELRNEVAAARERARALRQEYKREGKRPDWAQVRLQVLKPLVEVRDHIADELARRESREALAPVDRDPVPNRYSELVRRYYEALGKDK